MTRSAEIVLSFAGEERTFRLAIGRIRALQEKCDCGPMELLSRFSAGTWRVDDLRETILQGLIGGGMFAADAAKLLRTDFDDLPLQQFVNTAQAVVMACLIGPGDEDLGEREGEEAETRPSPVPNTVSAASTEQEPS